LRLILNKHRNALLELIQSAKLDPQAFRRIDGEIKDGESLRIELVGTPHYFDIFASLMDTQRMFLYKQSTFKIAYPNPIIGDSSWPYRKPFNEIQEQFKVWLDSVVKGYLKYLDEEEEDRALPDLWADLAFPSALSHSPSALQNIKFSIGEQTRIAKALHEFEEEVQSREILTREQIKLLHEQVEYLVDASKRLGRKDWLAAATGALIGFTLQSGLTTEVATQVIRLAGAALQWIAHTPLLLQ